MDVDLGATADALACGVCLSGLTRDGDVDEPPLLALAPHEGATQLAVGPQGHRHIE